MKTVKVFVIEEQEIYREAYTSVLPLRDMIDLLGVTTIEGNGSIKRIISKYNPEVLVFGMKKLNNDFIEDLARLRRDNPQIGIVLLAMSYDAESMDLIRESAIIDKGGIAIFSKQSLDQIEQLQRIIISVS